MNGQWIGRYEGTDPGGVTVNIDATSDNYVGTATLFPDNTENAPPGAHAIFQTESKAPQQSFRAQPILGIHPDTGLAVDWDLVKARYPGATHANYADVTVNLTNGILNLSWTTDNQATGKAALSRSDASKPSQITPIPRVTNWIEYKAFVASVPHRAFIFRGQTNPWRLQTGYHRTGRANLTWYRNNDIPTLYRHLSGKTRHFFQLSDPDQMGAFYSLIQHHGYPTPLLDWSYSPYVAAFFAYRHVDVNEVGPDAKVRIFCFDQAAWRRTYLQLLYVDHPKLHFSIADFLAVENERLVPQQSVSSVTNIDDIETYIGLCETRNKTHYLAVIDLPARERNTVMRELSVMGITAGSLFPGLDGACEELRERFFSTGSA